MSNNSLIRFLLPFIITFVALVICAILFFSKPSAKKRPPQQSNIVVQVATLEEQSLTPMIQSYGTVEARVESKLVAQVGGRIEFVSDQFRDGGYFKQGDLLLRVEAADYEIELEIARANLLDAERQLEEEQARVKLAEEDWRRLGTEKEPAALVLRRPQLKAAQANLQAAKARHERAQLNLDRTKIRAPFDGRVITTNVDLGQVVPANTALGDIFASDIAEVRLPIKSADLKHLDISAQDSLAKLSVSIISEFDETSRWPARIVRSSSTVDRNTRQLYLVAEIKNAFATEGQSGAALRVGQYVTAEIEGVAIPQAITIPNHAIYQGSYLFTYLDGAVFRKEIDIAWQDDDVAILRDGLSAGDQIVISPLGKVPSGTAVRLDTEETAPNKTNDGNKLKAAKRPEKAS